MNKRRTKESLIRRYLHLPGWVRRKTDGLFKKKRGFDEKVNRKAVKGKVQFRHILIKGLKELFGR